MIGSPSAENMSPNFRPLLLSDTAYFPTVDGNVTFSRGSRSFEVRGNNVGRAFAQLAPHLDGRRTVGELTRPMSERAAAAVQSMLATLVKADMLVAFDPQIDALIPPNARACFDAQIRFLHHVTDTPAQAFYAYRSARVGLVGQGVSFQWAAKSLLRNGLQYLHISCPADDPSVQAVQGVVAELARSGVTCVVDGPAPASQMPDDLTAALYVADAFDPDAAAELQRWCAERGALFLPAVIIDGHARIGPANSSPDQPCWTCALLRMSEQMQPVRAAGLWRSVALHGAPVEADDHSMTPILAIQGNQAAYRLYQTICGFGVDGSVIESINCYTLETTRTKLLASPLCSSAHRYLEAPPAKAEDVLVGRSCGVFSHFDDDDLAQLPVFQSKLVTSAGSANPLVRAISFQSNQEARRAALMQAACNYALDLARAYTDLRRTVPDIAAAAAIAKACPRGHLVGTSWPDGLEHAVPIRPALGLRDVDGMQPEIPAEGVGAGSSFEEAAQVARVSLILSTALKELAVGARSLTRLPAPSRRSDSGLLMEFWACSAYGQQICCLYMNADDPRETFVGIGATQAEAARRAAAEAVVLGPESRFTLDRLLPERLGYQRNGWREASSCADAAGARPNHGAAERLRQVCVDITPADLRAAGLVVVRSVKPDAAIILASERHELQSAVSDHG
jgi:hypothetical protein